MSMHICPECSFTYDSDVGDEFEGYPANTAFDDLPEDFACPDCGVRFKIDFKLVSSN
ncbi:MAG TPA: rubredoxin [Woeseiaceae bacterium]|nr:rubredoxin [Woeseiaceae bacterium]